MYPRIIIDSKAIEHNVNTVRDMCSKAGVRVVGVTKGVCASTEIVRAFLNASVDVLADSRIQNIKLLTKEFPDTERWLLRPPSASQLEDVVRLCHVSFNSEEDTLFALNKTCEKLQCSHSVVLLIDMGDRRDGFADFNQLKAACQLVRALPRLRLAGIACNLTCLSFVKATSEKLDEFARMAKRLRKYGKRGEPFIVSGGNSATLRLMLNEGLPDEITDLRLGESLLIGRERDTYKYLPNTSADTFVIEAEVIEVKRKQSMPSGEINKNSYGTLPKFKDRGEETRVVLALGNQDCAPGVMQPLDKSLRIVGDSCDHIVCAATNETNIHVGDIVRLRCGYHAILRAMNSTSVAKEFI